MQIETRELLIRNNRDLRSDNVNCTEWHTTGLLECWNENTRTILSNPNNNKLQGYEPTESADA